MAAAILNDHVTLVTAWDSMTNEQSNIKVRRQILLCYKGANKSPSCINEAKLGDRDNYHEHIRAGSLILTKNG